MKSRNGISRNFRFIIDNDTILNFSFKYKTLKESTQEKWVKSKDIGGNKKQKFLYLHYFFEIDWSELIEGEDSDKLQILRNAEYNGSKIEIVPHTDLPTRRMEVISMKSDDGDSQTIEFSQSVNRPDSLGNIGTVMIYETKKSQYYWDIRDPSAQQGVSAFAYKEFML